jgi:hypothetical protein
MLPTYSKFRQAAFCLLASFLVTACGLNLGAVKPESFKH